MFKNLSLELMQEVQVKGSDILSLKDFNERDGRLFFIDEYFDNSNEEMDGGSHTAMELIPNTLGIQNRSGVIYTVKPVYIYNDAKDRIIDVVPLEEVFKDEKQYFIYWKDLFKNFIKEVCSYVKYDQDTLIDVLKELIEKYPEESYYYADGNNNEFAFEILDQYKFVGELTHGMSDRTVVISNVRIEDKQTEDLLKKMPWVQIDGYLDTSEEEDENSLFAEILNSMSKEDMKQYILEAVTKSLTVCK